MLNVEWFECCEVSCAMVVSRSGTPHDERTTMLSSVQITSVLYTCILYYCTLLATLPTTCTVFLRVAQSLTRLSEKHQERLQKSAKSPPDSWKEKFRR